MDAEDVFWEDRGDVGTGVGVGVGVGLGDGVFVGARVGAGVSVGAGALCAGVLAGVDVGAGEGALPAQAANSPAAKNHVANQRNLVILRRFEASL